MCAMPTGAGGAVAVTVTGSMVAEEAMADQPAVRTLDPDTAKRLLDEGKAYLVDVREANEHAAERIPGAELRPMSSFNPANFPEKAGKHPIFHCAGGGRSARAAEAVAATTGTPGTHLGGGLAAWKDAGLPVEKGKG